MLKRWTKRTSTACGGQELWGRAVLDRNHHLPARLQRPLEPRAPFRQRNDHLKPPQLQATQLQFQEHETATGNTLQHAKEDMLPVPTGCPPKQAKQPKPHATGDSIVQPVEVAETQDLVQHWADLSNQSVTVYGACKPFQELLNVPLRRLAAAVLEPQSTLINSVEQSNKTMLAVGIALACCRIKRPFVLVGKDQVQNVREVARKMDAVLRQFNMSCEYVSTQDEFERLAQLREQAEEDSSSSSSSSSSSGRTTACTRFEAFKQGSLALVVPAITQPLSHFNDFVCKADICDMVVIIDEADAVWTTFMDVGQGSRRAIMEAARGHGAASMRRKGAGAAVAAGVEPGACAAAEAAAGAGPWPELSLSMRREPTAGRAARAPAHRGIRHLLTPGATLRELQLYRLLGCPPLHRGSEHPSRVRSLVQISATNLATIHWHMMAQLPFSTIACEEAELQSKGYTVYKHLRPYVPPGASQPQFLAAASCSGNRYNLDDPLVLSFLEGFAADARPGKMLMWAVCHTVNAGAVNALVVARRALELVPGSVVLVRHGKGTTLLHGGSAEHCSHLGAHNVVRRAAPSLPGGGGRLANRAQRPPAASLMEVINSVHAAHGPGTPIVVVGYTCLQRCVSVRGDERVVTHMIVAPTKGKSTADTKQMFMRCAGFNGQQRERYGFTDGVSLLCTREDMDVVKGLYGFTNEALRRAGTGRPEDLVGWSRPAFDDVHHPVIRSRRPHSPKKMRVTELVQSLRLSSDSDSELPDAAPRRRPQQHTLAAGSSPLDGSAMAGGDLQPWERSLLEVHQGSRVSGWFAPIDGWDLQPGCEELLQRRGPAGEPLVVHCGPQRMWLMLTPEGQAAADACLGRRSESRGAERAGRSEAGEPDSPPRMERATELSLSGWR